MNIYLDFRRLYERGAQCRGLAVDLNGVGLGPDCALVKRTPTGYRITDPQSVAIALNAISTTAFDSLAAANQLMGIASALDAGNLAKAQILGLQSQFAALTELQIIQMTEAVSFAKYSDDQPRDFDGKWTAGEGGARSPSLLAPQTAADAETTTILSTAGEAEGAEVATTSAVALAARVALVATGALAVGATLLVATNGSNIHSGEIPGHPGLTYRSDEGVLTIRRLGQNGEIQELYRGFPDTNGFYHDSNGQVVGQLVGTSISLSNDQLSLFDDPPVQTKPAPDSPSSPQSVMWQDEPQICPDPTPENIKRRSARAIAYQSQITGLLPGFDMLLNGVRFDGCDEDTGRMLEAKGLGSEWLFERMDSMDYAADYYDQIIKQAGNQSRAAAGRGVDWHFADRGQALFYYLEFKAHHFDNISVKYTEPIIKKIDDCMDWIQETLEIAVIHARILINKSSKIQEVSE